MDSVERLWAECDFVSVKVEGQTKRKLAVAPNCSPAMTLPAWASGQCREDMAAGCVVELLVRAYGRDFVRDQLRQAGQLVSLGVDSCPPSGD